MVTEADPSSSVQVESLALITNSETLSNYIMKFAIEDEDDYDIQFPYLVFIYNAMVKREE